MTTINSDIVNSVQQLYVAYFNRPADVGGLNYWASVVAAQGGTAAVSASFAKSAEYKAAFAGKSSFEVVDQIYQNLFGRHAELAGLGYWGLLLDQGKITIDNAVTQIAGGAQGSDLTAYGNKVAASVLFTTALDSANSALAYLGAAAAQSAKDYISSITDNASFADKTTPAAITTAVANLVAAHDGESNTPQTLILTTNFDTFVPTSTQKLAGNDTFISNNPGTGATFNAFDNLDGGAGTDVLKIASADYLVLSSAATVKNIESAEIQSASGFEGNTAGWTGLTKLTASSVNGTDLTAAATTAVTLTSSISGASTTKVTGGAAVTVSLTTGSATVSNATTISKGTGNLTYTHVGAQTGATTLDSTTGNVTSTETGVTTGSLTISKTTGNVVATRNGEVSGAISVTGTTGTVALTTTHSADTTVTGGAITVTGGTTINVTQATTALNKTFTNGAVAVTGGATTTAVIVNNAVNATAAADVAGAAVNSVGIQDANYTKSAAGTITSATVTGFSTLSINDAALTTLSVTGGTGNIIIDNTPTAAVVGPPAVPIQPTATTLGLTINGQTGGTLDDADIYTTLNITTAGTANSTLANITTGAVTAMTVAGTKGLTLTSAAGLTALKTVTVSGAAGLKADLSGATVTSVSTAATTGASTVTIDGSKATFTGGAGADVVTLAATASSKAITLGAGDDTLDATSATALTSTVDAGTGGTDTLKITAATAATASADAAFAGQVTNFERLVLTGALAQTVDVAVLGSFNYVTTSAGNGLTLTNLPTGGTLVLNGAGTAYTVSNTAFTGGTNDILNLVLTDGSGAGVSFAATGVTASNVETINVTTADTQATPSGSFNDSITLLGNSVKSIAVAGNAGLTLTAASTAATSVDASGITLGGFTWTSGALAAAATVKGSATGANTVDVGAATKAVTYTGGTGVDTVTLGAATNNHAINLGGGTSSNTVTGGTAGGNISVTSTAGTTSSLGVDTGVDTVTLGNGNNTVSLGAGKNVFTAGNGLNTYTGGAGVDQVTVGSGQNVLTLGTGADTVTFSAVPTGVNGYTTIADAHKGVTITVANQGVESFGSKIVLASTAVFQDYANAVVAQGGDASGSAHWGWFQFAQTSGGVTTTDTYLVQSRHDGSGVNPAFVAGQDFIVKLTGVVELSLATGGTTNTITLG